MLRTAPDHATAATPARRADVRFLLSHPAHFIALGAGSGLSPLAPGTVGTLWAWLAWAGIANGLTPGQQALLLLASAAVGWWACTVAARNLQALDPGAIVWDEVLAFWLVLWLAMPMGFMGQLVAFLLFRFFDAVKPQPVRWADALFPGFGWKAGFGIVFDDLVAAFCTLLVIAAWRAW